MTTSLAALHERQFYAQVIGATQLVAIDGGVHISAPLAVGGRYVLMSPDAPFYVRQGGPGLTVTSSDAFVESQAFSAPICVDDLLTNRIAVMAAAGLGGTLYITRLDTAAGSAVAHKAQFFGRFIGPTVQAAIGLVSTVMSALVQGARYEILCVDDDLHVRQGALGLTATSSDLYLPAGVAFTLNADDSTNDHLAALSATGVGGTLRATRIDSAS